MTTSIVTDNAIKGGSGRIVTITAASATLAPDPHSGKIILLDRATGIAVTLPAATGSGDIYVMTIKTSVSGGSTTITTAGSDTMVGQVETTSTTGSTTGGFAESAGGADKTITWNGSTTGGLSGTTITCTDIASSLWNISGQFLGSGGLATSIS